ncbi:WhiB family transcriptional regulator [Pseudonocardia alni]|uniref:WhiB family transcriptional regulator n=1 Tax=Pseudonocardia alni TaxID=33907 RepID=UPI0037C5FD80
MTRQLHDHMRRPGDGFLAGHSRRAALPAHQQKAGEEPMVERDDDRWRARAACRSADPETFFPTADVGALYDREVARAKRVCRRCPVQAVCREWAIAYLPHGVAGGMSEEERRRARRASARRVRRAELGTNGPTPVLRTDRAHIIAAGRAALAEGVDREEIARTLGVTRRTVDRWAATVTASIIGGGR